MTKADGHSEVANSYSNEYLKQILTDVKTIAMVGASPTAERDSHKVMRSLLAHGYTVIPVNPKVAGDDILGQRCYANLASIQQPIDMVDIFRNSEAALGVTQEAIAVGAKVVWMQLGVINHQAAALATAAGVKVVMNRCPKIELAKSYWTGRADNTESKGKFMENNSGDS